MPFTYLSHQAPVLAIKLRWPAAFNGTASQEQPLVVPQLEQTKQAPARCMTMPHW